MLTKMNVIGLVLATMLGGSLLVYRHMLRRMKNQSGQYAPLSKRELELGAVFIHSSTYSRYRNKMRQLRRTLEQFYRETLGYPLTGRQWVRRRRNMRAFAKKHQLQSA